MGKAEGYFWQKTGGKRIIVGITQKALSAAGDVRVIQLPERGIFLRQGDPLVTFISPAGVLQLPSPLTGQVVEVNWELAKHPELLTSVCERWIAILIPKMSKLKG